MWRNWQTHKTQNLARATSCGFKSHHPHKKGTCFMFLFLLKTHLFRIIFRFSVAILSIHIFYNDHRGFISIKSYFDKFSQFKICIRYFLFFSTAITNESSFRQTFFLFYHRKEHRVCKNIHFHRLDVLSVSSIDFYVLANQ